MRQMLQPRPGEHHFTRGAWLTLAAVVLVVVWPLVTTLIGYDYPSDGWTIEPIVDVGGYKLQYYLSHEPTPLRKGDFVLAIADQTLSVDNFPILRQRFSAGQIVHYTIQRDGRTLEIDIPLVRRGPAALGRYLVEYARKHPIDTLTVPLLLAIVGFAFVRRPGHAAARYLLVAFGYFLGGSWFSLADFNLYYLSYSPPLTALNLFASYSWACIFFPSLTLLALVFPVRKWPLRRFPRLLPALLYGVPITVTALFLERVLATGAEPSSAYWLLVIALLVFLVTLAGSLIHNFLTVRDPIVRAQLRWVALGLGAGSGFPLLLTIGAALLSITDPAIRGALDLISAPFLLLLPASLAVAITRYRLFDIDVIIRRTLVYSVLTLTLGLVYVGCILISQALAARLAGSSELATVVSTLVIAALFFPLRRRIQNIIDRRFYRRKYNAQQVLAQFALAARDETHINALTGELLRVVDETMQPEFVGLWLRDSQARSKTEVTRPDSGPPR